MTCSRKLWYTKFMCLVCARILGTFAISIAPLLSSNLVYTILGVVLTTLKPLHLNSVSKFMIGIILRRDYDRATYSASVVDKLIWVWRLEAQIMGQSVKSMIKSVRDSAVLTLCSAVDILYFPLKSASTYTLSYRLAFTLEVYLAYTLIVSRSKDGGERQNVHFLGLLRIVRAGGQRRQCQVYCIFPRSWVCQKLTGN